MDKRILNQYNALIQLSAAIIEMGGRGSGDWGHTGRPGKRGGSGGGGGLKGIGLKPGSSVEDRRAASAKKKEGRKGGGGGSSAPDTDPKTWKDRLTEKESDAITTYTTSKYQSINKGLREGNLSKADEKTVGELDSALSKSRLTKDTALYENQKLYRAAEIPEVNAAIKSGNLVGLEFTEKGYTSTTTEKDIAKNFQRGKESRLFVINAPKGTKAANVSELSNIAGEKETLIGRNTTYKVSRIEKVKERVLYRDFKGKIKSRQKTIEYIHLDVVDQQ